MCVCVWTAVVPVLLSLTGQCKSVIVGVGGVSLPVHHLHPHRVDTLIGQQVQNFITHPVLAQHVPKTLQGES